MTLFLQKATLKTKKKLQMKISPRLRKSRKMKLKKNSMRTEITARTEN